MNKQVDIAVIGAGASGLMLSALLNNKNIALIDNNSKIGSKILISGGGKCNITNGKVKPTNYLGEQHFIRNVIKQFDQYDLLKWLSTRGLKPIVRRRNQYFCKNSAKELVDIFKAEISSKSYILNTKVQSVKKVDNCFKILTNKGTIIANIVVVASGGASFPKIGATTIGYDIAKSFGHKVNTLSAGLVGFTLQPEQFFFKELSGIAIDVKITIDKKEVEGALLFAHKGISGPAVLDASLYWNRGKITIDFLPTLSIDSLKSSKKHISKILGLPSRVAKRFLEVLKIEDKASNRLTHQEWQKIEELKKYSFAPAGTFGYSKAEVTKGGVATDEVDASSMMSKKVDNLYFLGEVLDVTGELGGYNFQWAFSTAFVCAKGLN
ncbi:NAD(FAD)-utilizing dehydrogenases [hydrothermal vent metagenome]|uniref:NAD(FAD)-utilizing dehydrogenases n=1 Tax=hydrothermal vent metagenome TaxID=652676 RepID=A0A1W1BXJ8_9ZZZZ